MPMATWGMSAAPVRSRDVDLLCGLVRDEWALLAAMRGLHEVDDPGLGRLNEP